jgi:predicted membrane-bound spermidine synthase
MLSAALLLGPTVLMGGTLPLLAAWLQKSAPDAGRRSARFYSTNSLGAVLGAGLAGFFLVTWLGLPVTVQMTGLVNVFIGFIAVGVAKLQADKAGASAPLAEAPQSVSVPAPERARLFRWGCVLVALTGAVSMGLEVLASRCLSLIFGASLQAFAIVLMAFILGIGLGSAIIASPRRKDWPKEITTIFLVLGAATWIGLLVYRIETLVDLYRYARSGLNNNSIGYNYLQVMTGMISMLVLGLPAAALGSVLPLWIRVLSENSELLGQRVGRLLTWNTLGAVGGVLLTGFVLMPHVGLRGSFAALALVLSGVALLMAWVSGRRLPAVAAGLVGGLLVIISATGGANWRTVLSCGVFRWREKEISAGPMEDRLKNERILFYEDAADATVAVEERSQGIGAGRSLRVNGKTDASTRGDLSTQVLLAHLPLMARPGAKDVFVFGLGSGITAGSVLGHPIERLTIAENCDPVLRAAQFFAPWNHGVLTNTRARVIREDARTVLKLTSQQFDVIIAEPSNPWTIGVGSVFSREFYEISARRLKPGGVMAQWFHVYEINDGIVNLVMRTFGSVFPVMEIWDTSNGDLVLLGSQQPWRSDRAARQQLLTRDGPRHDLAEIGITNPEALLARQFASQRTGFAVAGPGPVQTDDYPILEYQAPRAFFIGALATRYEFFDERTWQAGIAPAEKVSQLASLDEAALKTVFGEYRSATSDMKVHINSLNNGGLELMGGGMRPPWAFTGVHSAGLQPPPMAATNSIARQLFEAEVSLHSEPAKRLEAIKQIQKILEGATAYEHGQGWSATYYTCLAAQASLSLGDSARARKVLFRGLLLEPNSETMQYLARIMEREGILQAGEVPTGPHI